MSSGRPKVIKLNHISDDRNSIDFVRSRLKHTDSVLEQLRLEEKKRKDSNQCLFKILKEKRREIRERLQTDLLEFHD